MKCTSVCHIVHTLSETNTITKVVVDFVFFIKRRACLVDVVELHVDNGVGGRDEEGQRVVQRLHR